MWVCCCCRCSIRGTSGLEVDRAITLTDVHMVPEGHMWKQQGLVFFSTEKEQFMNDSGVEFVVQKQLSHATCASHHGPHLSPCHLCIPICPS